MSSLARTERSALCDTALQTGEDKPTLCAGWAVKDLVAHLLLREGSPAAAGIVVPPLARFTDLEMRRLAGRDFAGLVERLRGGPPLYSPMRLPRLDKTLNTLEFFVHHEDIRRAQPGWQPRDLAPRVQDVLWRMIGTASRGLLRAEPGGVTLERSDNGQRSTPRAGHPTTLVRGLPAELTMWVFGRRDHADVEVSVLGEETDAPR